MDKRKELRRHKKTFLAVWKVAICEFLQHLLPPSLLSLSGPFLKVLIVNHRCRGFVNLPGQGTERIVLQYFDVR